MPFRLISSSFVAVFKFMAANTIEAHTNIDNINLFIVFLSVEIIFYNSIEKMVTILLKNIINIVKCNINA